MSLNVVLVNQRQSPQGMALSWSGVEGVASYTVFVAQRRLSPEELEAALALGGTDECVVTQVGAEVGSVVDDVTPAGEPRFYGVAMSFSDGAVRAARFKAVPDGATAESFPLSGAKARKEPASAAPAPRPAAAPRTAAPAASPSGDTGSYRVAPVAPPPGNTGSYRIAQPPQASSGNTGSHRIAQPAQAPTANTGAYRVAQPAQAPTGDTGSLRVGSPAAAAPDEDPLEARKRAQREARARALASADTASADPARASSAELTAAGPARSASSRAEAAAEPPRPASTRAEAPAEPAARAVAAARPAREEAPASNEPPPPPSAVPLDEPLDVRFVGGNQTWDGLRLTWERDPRAAAYEIIASDHQIFGSELREALEGKADFTTAVAVAPSVTAVIDNVTPRESRGWYAVLLRTKDGRRRAHPFQLGDAATSGRVAAPFLNPNRTHELRFEVEDLVEQAKEQWARWTAEQDGGARREAQRIVADVLLMWPDFPGAKALQAQLK